MELENPYGVGWCKWVQVNINGPYWSLSPIEKKAENWLSRKKSFRKKWVWMTLYSYRRDDNKRLYLFLYFGRLCATDTILDFLLGFSATVSKLIADSEPACLLLSTSLFSCKSDIFSIRALFIDLHSNKQESITEYQHPYILIQNKTCHNDAK